MINLAKARHELYHIKMLKIKKLYIVNFTAKLHSFDYSIDKPHSLNCSSIIIITTCGTFVLFIILHKDYKYFIK